MAVVTAGYAGLHAKTMDPLDAQQFLVERLMLPFLKESNGESDIPLIVQATQVLMHRIDTDFSIIVTELQQLFKGQIACVTGVTINTADGNFFYPSMHVVRNSRTVSTLPL